jgi:DNA-binding transcriptional LysR family regulator
MDAVMDLKQLRYFLAVAEEAHFGRAAQRLHIVQPALSMQIRTLEASLGASLFKRTSRRVELTEAGALLRIEAERTVAQAERASLIVQRASRGEIGSIRIGFAGFSAFTGGGVASRHIRSFHARYPKVELQFSERQPDVLVEDVMAARLDLGYTIAPPAHTFDAGLDVDLGASWPWVVAVPPDHPLAAHDTLSAKSLRAEPFVQYHRSVDDTAWLNLLRRILGREPLIAYRVSTILTAMAIVAGGLALALAPAEALTQIKLPGLAFRPLTVPPQQWRLILLSRADETAGAVNAYLRLIRAQSAQLQQGR